MVPLRILIVDDEAVMRELLSAVLEGYDHQVQTAEDGDEAIRLLENNVYDLVITDLQMSPVSGLEVVRYARACSDEMMIFLMTGCRDAQCAVDAYRFGADAFLTKPFGIEELLGHISFHTIKLLSTGQLQIERFVRPAAVSE